MNYEELKAEFNRRLVLNPGHGFGDDRISIGDSDNITTRFVSGSLICYKSPSGEVQYNTEHQICHSFLNGIHRQCFDQDIIVIDRIMGGNRESLLKFMDHREEVQFLQYFMDHELFKHSFLEHDAEKAFKERLMVRDVSTLPANACAFAFIATRSLWEGGFNRLPRRMARLIDLGFKPDFAYVMSYYFDVILPDKELKYSTIANTGHAALPTSSFTVQALKNYVRYVIGTPAPGSLTQVGYQNNWSDSRVIWNVNSTFEGSYVSPYGGSKSGETIASAMFELMGSSSDDDYIGKLFEFQDKIYA